MHPERPSPPAPLPFPGRGESHILSPGPIPFHSRGESRTRSAGFSLVELIVVIMVIGILGATVGVFIANPVRSYFATIDRAALTDAADLVVRRMARELQGAVPNSARVAAGSNNSVFLEFVPINDFGRYRAAASNSDPTQNDPLDFSNPADNSFQVLGPAVTAIAGSKIVIMNQGARFGAANPMNLYTGGNVRTVTSIGSGLTSLQFAAAGAWPAASPTHRFYLFTTAVSYVCVPGANGTGTITRYYGYAPQAAQPTSTGAAPLSGASQSLVLNDVSSCGFTPGSAQVDLNALQINLQLTRSGESVTLYSQVNSPNGP